VVGPPFVSFDFPEILCQLRGQEKWWRFISEAMHVKKM
jgi:hypothetical protein